MSNAQRIWDGLDSSAKWEIGDLWVLDGAAAVREFLSDCFVDPAVLTRDFMRDLARISDAWEATR